MQVLIWKIGEILGSEKWYVLLRNRTLITLLICVGIELRRQLELYNFSELRKNRYIGTSISIGSFSSSF